MYIDLQAPTTWDRKMEVTVPWERVAATYQQIVAPWQSLSVRGFRPGKIPPSVWNATYGKEIQKELVARLASPLCREAFHEKGITRHAPIAIKEAHYLQGKSFSFTAYFTLIPPFDLPDYAHLQLMEQNTSQQIDEVTSKLLEATTLSVPSSLVDNECAYGTETLPEQRRQAAHDRVKLMLILKEIAAKEGIEVDDRDIEERLNQMVRQNDPQKNDPRQNDQEVAALKESLLQAGSLPRLADAILAEYVLQFIIDNQLT